MDCPQCGGTLDTYALDGQEASVCEDCGYVGIAAEHRGEARRIESWDDALRRFYRARGTDAEPGVEVRPPLSRPGGDSTDESWDDAFRRFHARRTGTAADADEPGDAEADDTDEADPDAEATDSDADRPASRTRSQSSAGDS
jgi:hypothetical protein